MIKEYDNKISGSVGNVINYLKVSMKNMIDLIQVDSADFDCDSVEMIQKDIDDILEVINALYQDLITEKLRYKQEVIIFRSPMNNLVYEIKES